MKNFKFATANEYIAAIAAETKSAERAILLEAYKNFRIDDEVKNTAKANARAKAELEAKVSEAVSKTTASFKMNLQAAVDALYGKNISISEFLSDLNDSHSDVSLKLDIHLNRQATQFTIREQWVSGQRRLSL